MDPKVSIWIIQSLLILVLLYLAYIDWRTFRLPNAITFPLIILGIAFNAFSDLRFTSPSSAFVGAFLGYGLLWALNTGYRLLKNRDGIGMGDAKLLSALGVWLGWVALPSILFLASISGIIGGMIWLKLNKQNHGSAFPFGPFLIFAGIMELLWPQLLQNLLLSNLS